MKLKSLFMAFIMLFTMTTYTSCGKGSNAEVQLVSVNGSRSVIQEEKEVYKTKHILKENEEEPEKGDDEDEYVLDTLGYNLLILPTSVMQYDITINLNNPHDHSIQDFRIQTDDTTLKIFNLNLKRWDAIDTTKSIKWLGSDNQSFKFSLLSESEESATSIKITEILYLNRKAQRVENVNLSTGPDYVDVVKADMPNIEKVKVYQDAENYITIDYRVNFGKGTKNVKIDGELVEEGKVYTTKYRNHPELTWEILYKEKSINASYEKELFTSLIDVYGINNFYICLPDEWGGSDPSTLAVVILYNHSYSFYDESTDLKFNILRNGERTNIESKGVERLKDGDTLRIHYYCKIGGQELKKSDTLSIYVLNGEEEIMLVKVK